MFSLSTAIKTEESFTDFVFLYKHLSIFFTEPLDPKAIKEQISLAGSKQSSKALIKQAHLDADTLDILRYPKVMMRLAQWTVPFTLVCAVLLSPLSQARADTSHAELYQRSGLDQQLGLLWREIGAEYAGLPKISTHHLLEQSIQSLIKSEFSEPHLRETILQHWGDELSDEDISSVSDWLASPTGRNLTTAEISASLVADEAVLSTYLAELREQPPSKIRIDLLRLLDKALHSSDASTDLGIHINLAAVTALHASGFAADNAKSPAEQAQSHESDRAFIRAIMRQDILRHNLFVYRALEDEALRAYIEFAESPAGSRFHKSTFFATRTALTKATQELQKQILGLMPEAETTAQLTTE